MVFEELDREMRAFEQSLDQSIEPGLFMAARLDGRGFTRLTKELCDFDAPFDLRFRDMMLQALRSLMDCGFHVIYGYTQSDEISLLFRRDEQSFGRKTRKYNSILAGQASAAFSLALGQAAVMDCRMIPLPDEERVRDYFLWRQEDARRNALNAHCYWLSRREGLTPKAANARLEGKSMEFKQQLLLSRGIDFDALPLWQKRGVGMYRVMTEKQGLNPLTGERVSAPRRELVTDPELPAGKDYGAMISDIISKNL